MTLDPNGTQASKRTVHFSHGNPIRLCSMIQAHFDGTRMTIVPSGTQGTFRIVDPRGRQVPFFHVIKRKHPTEGLLYFFVEIR